MNKSELETHAEKICEYTDQIHRDCFVNGYVTGALKREQKIADIKANCDLAIEGRDVKIKELEADNRLLEQRGSDILKELLDKNKRCIELEKENAELTKDRDYYSDALDKQIEATLKLNKEYTELKEQVANLEGIKLAKTAKVPL